jgi:mitochondrial chaperone BCS1
MTLLDTAYSTLASNQFLVGGVGTLAFGSLMYVLRAVPQKMLDIIERTVWTTVFVESLSNEYRDVDAFIEGRRLDFFCRSLEIKDGGLKNGVRRGMGNLRGDPVQIFEDEVQSASHAFRNHHGFVPYP